MAICTEGKLSRRQFVTQAASVSVAFTIVPRHVLGGEGHVAPSEKLNVAVIGCGGQPGINRSTGSRLSSPSAISGLPRNTPPEIVQFPTAMTTLGAGTAL